MGTMTGHDVPPAALVAVAAALVAAVLAARRGRRSPKGEESRTKQAKRRRNRRKLDPKDCLVQRFDLRPSPCPDAPKKPLPLAGRTFVVKDNIKVAGFKTGNGVFTPTEMTERMETSWWKHLGRGGHGVVDGKSADCVQKLLDLGARGVGKAKLDQLAISIEGENDLLGTPVNPVSSSLIPGGSSSGSAVAVGSGLCDFAIGTDTCGSTRIPAACCGVFGMRPTISAVSTRGVVPLAPTFDTVGWFARDPALLRAVGKGLLSSNPKYLDDEPPQRVKKVLIADDLFAFCEPNEELGATTRMVASVAARKMLGSAHVAHVKVGNFLNKQCGPELRPWKQKLIAASADGMRGATSVEEALDAVALAGRFLVIHEMAETYRPWCKNVKDGRDALGPTCRERLDRAMETLCTEEDVEMAIKARVSVGEALNDALSKGKVLVLPAMPVAPIKKDLPKDEVDQWRTKVFRAVVLASFAGLPQATIPMGMSADKKVPLSVSIIGSRGSDALVLDAVHAIAPLITEAFEAAMHSRKSERRSKKARRKKKTENGTNAKMSSQQNSPSETNSNGSLSPEDEAAVTRLKDKGNDAFRAGRFYEAVQLYSRAIEFNEGQYMPVLYSNRAMAYLKLGNFVMAERDCSSGLAMDPMNVKALLRRGTARAYLSQFENALGDFERVLDVEPGNIQAAQEINRIKMAFSTPEYVA